MTEIIRLAGRNLKFVVDYQVMSKTKLKITTY